MAAIDAANYRIDVREILTARTYSIAAGLYRCIYYGNVMIVVDHTRNISIVRGSRTQVSVKYLFPASHEPDVGLFPLGDRLYKLNYTLGDRVTYLQKRAYGKTCSTIPFFACDGQIVPVFNPCVAELGGSSYIAKHRAWGAQTRASMELCTIVDFGAYWYSTYPGDGCLYNIDDKVGIKRLDPRGGNPAEIMYTEDRTNNPYGQACAVENGLLITMGDGIINLFDARACAMIGVDARLRRGEYLISII